MKSTEEIKKQSNEDLTLANLSKRSGYSEFYMTRKFKAISGMSFRDYLRYRKLAFALKEVRDSEKSMLEIALNYGFSSHEALYPVIQAYLRCIAQRLRKRSETFCFAH